MAGVVLWHRQEEVGDGKQAARVVARRHGSYRKSLSECGEVWGCGA